MDNYCVKTVLNDWLEMSKWIVKDKLTIYKVLEKVRLKSEDTAITAYLGLNQEQLEKLVNYL